VGYVQAAGGAAGTARRELLADFREHDLTIEEHTGGRFATDTGSFSERAIPTVGLYTGAGGPKSEAQASAFGGAASCPYDPCYHQACDTLENINREVLEENTRARAGAQSRDDRRAGTGRARTQAVKPRRGHACALTMIPWRP
jgi:Zn-dependent M28 family amino/carboxypeptidase